MKLTKYIYKVILNLIQDLQRLPLLFANNVRGRFQIKFGMTSLCHNGGFTLIELLVVVLIIGILAAVAVPQYQKSVLKSRFSALMPLGRSVHEAQESYYLENNRYSNNFGDLPLDLDGVTGASVTLEDGTQVQIKDNLDFAYVVVGKENLPNLYVVWQNHSDNFPGEIHCEAQTGNELANWLCEAALGGEKLPRAITTGYTAYALMGDGDGWIPKQFNGDNNLVLTNGDSCKTTQATTCTTPKVSNGSACYAGHAYSCGGTQATYDNKSFCEATGAYTCNGATYTNKSYCNNKKGKTSGAIYSCINSKFRSGSYCISTRANCTGSDFNASFCYAEIGGCTDSTFKNGSVCYANSADSCGVPANYDGTSYCSSDKGFCPVGTPKEGGGVWAECTDKPGKTC